MWGPGEGEGHCWGASGPLMHSFQVAATLECQQLEGRDFCLPDLRFCLPRSVPSIQ